MKSLFPFLRTVMLVIAAAFSFSLPVQAEVKVGLSDWPGWVAWYIAEQLQHAELKERGLQVSRIAHGVPMGGELEYIDGSTLMHSLAGRQLMGKT